jgi:hypothetical protein
MQFIGPTGLHRNPAIWGARYGLAETMPWLLRPSGVRGKSGVEGLVGLSGAAFLKALIERLPALESGVDRMPEIYFAFAELPAEQDHLLPDLAGKIKQSSIEIFYLNANGIDLLNRVLGLLNCGPLGYPLSCHRRDVDQHPSGEEDIFTEHLQFCFD